MSTKNPAPTPIANSVSNMIDPPDGAPAPGRFVGLDLGDFVAFAGVLPLGLPEPYLKATTLLSRVPSTMERTCLATAAMILRPSARAAEGGMKLVVRPFLGFYPSDYPQPGSAPFSAISPQLSRGIRVLEHSVLAHSVLRDRCHDFISGAPDGCRSRAAGSNLYQRLIERAREHIDRAACRIGHQDVNGLARKIFRPARSLSPAIALRPRRDRQSPCSNPAYSRAPTVFVARPRGPPCAARRPNRSSLLT